MQKADPDVESAESVKRERKSIAELQRVWEQFVEQDARQKGAEAASATVSTAQDPGPSEAGAIAGNEL